MVKSRFNGFKLHKPYNPHFHNATGIKIGQTAVAATDITAPTVQPVTTTASRPIVTASSFGPTVPQTSTPTTTVPVTTAPVITLPPALTNTLSTTPFPASALDASQLPRDMAPVSVDTSGLSSGDATAPNPNMGVRAKTGSKVISIVGWSLLALGIGYGIYKFSKRKKN